MKIRTSFNYSAPDHSRYSAVTDDYDGPGSPIGSGATEIAAIRDLLDDIEDREEAELQAKRVDEEAEHAPHPDAEWMDQVAFEQAHAWGRLP